MTVVDQERVSMGTYLRQWATNIWHRFMLPEDDIRLVQLAMAGKRVAPQGHRIDVYGARSGLWYWVRDDTYGQRLIETHGPHAYEGALQGLIAMAKAAEAEERGET